MPTLKEMAAEVAAYQAEKGWDQPRSFAVSMALLHEEVAEAGHAWREWGFADQTLGISPERPQGHWNAKPEGVGGEFADILIRLLDADNRHDMLLAEHLEDDSEVFELDDEFMANINTLHGLLAGATWAYEVSEENPCAEFARVLVFLHQLARECGINLVAEYQRKMAFNHTREHRHGGRRV
jgi:NTP pyrophosphatase (non-canonical NTP hydrolase)